MTFAPLYITATSESQSDICSIIILSRFFFFHVMTIHGCNDKNALKGSWSLPVLYQFYAFRLRLKFHQFLKKVFCCTEIFTLSFILREVYITSSLYYSWIFPVCNVNAMSILSFFWSSIMSCTLLKLYIHTYTYAYR